MTEPTEPTCITCGTTANLPDGERCDSCLRAASAVYVVAAEPIPGHSLEFAWHSIERLLRRMAAAAPMTGEQLLFLRTELRAGGELAAGAFTDSVAHRHRCLYLDVLEALTAATQVDYHRLDVRDLPVTAPDDVSTLTDDLGPS